MALKANELIILSYINKYRKIDYEEIQKVVNEPLLQLSDAVYNLYEQGYFVIVEDKLNKENEVKVEVTEKALFEPIYSWNTWIECETPEFDGNVVYEGERNEKGVPIIQTISELEELLKLHNIDEDSYHVFEIYSGEKVRKILAPSKKLKERQRWILKNILYINKEQEYVHGFVKGKSIVTNAQCHVGKKEILCLDISHFFPTIKLDSVVNVFQNIGYSSEVALKLGKLCTYEDILPQGAPTSPTLANTVFVPVDEELFRYSLNNKLIYTRYADDLTFSTDDLHIENHISNISAIVEKHGYKINENKTHVMKDNYRKIVTGLLVNERVKVPKKFKNRLKQEIYYCRKYGVSQHLHAIGRNSAVNFKEYMYGKAYFIKMVEPGIGNDFLNQLDELFANQII